MDGYKKAYLLLWADCSAAIDAMEHQNFGYAREILVRALQQSDALLLTGQKSKSEPSDSACAGTESIVK